MGKFQPSDPVVLAVITLFEFGNDYLVIGAKCLKFRRQSSGRLIRTVNPGFRLKLYDNGARTDKTDGGFLRYLVKQKIRSQFKDGKTVLHIRDNDFHRAAFNKRIGNFADNIAIAAAGSFYFGTFVKY